jgi:hypothetical protein
MEGGKGVRVHFSVRDHVNQGGALGSEALINRIEATLNRRVRLARPAGQQSTLTPFFGPHFS